MKPLIAYIIYVAHLASLIYVGYLERGSFTGGGYITIIAILLIITGSLIYAAAFFKLGVAKSSHVNFSGLVTSGVYRFVRDPQILAWFLILTGISLYLTSFYSLLLTVALWLFFKTIFQPIEEKKLMSEYGEEYINYKKRTPSGI